MNILYALILLYITYYTLSFAKVVWQGGNKFSGIFIYILGAVIIIIPVVYMFVK